MKDSIYNNILTIEGKHTVIFNSFSGKFTILRDNTSIDRKTKLSDFVKEHPAYLEIFKSNNILVEDDIDETALLQKRIEDTDFDDSFYILNINPTTDCNFHCWYCYENHVEGSKMSSETVADIIRFIDRLLDENKTIKQFSLSFFGGEPLLYYKQVVAPIIAHADKACESKEIGFDIGFTSNGYLITDEMVEELKPHNSHFQITLDGGPEHHDNTRFTKGGVPSFDRIVSNIILCSENGIPVNVRINYTDKNIDSCKKILDYFIKDEGGIFDNISFDFQRVWQQRTNKADDAEETASAIRDAFRNAGYNVHTNYLLRDVRYSCYGDKRNHVLINYDGMAYGCTARDFNEQNSIGRLNHDGEIKYDLEKYERRFTAKVSKPICRQCRIAPLCGGGCRQSCVETLHHDGCNLGYTEEDKDKKILSLLEHMISNSPQIDQSNP